mmetsp:Transcript_1232/g.2941  ORF Transcript_1232/g.2941 Transcript_1232/m.2941 type:complete len:202 (-) Transcript_1232:756-1361(-)
MASLQASAGGSSAMTLRRTNSSKGSCGTIRLPATPAPFLMTVKMASSLTSFMGAISRMALAKTSLNTARMRAPPDNRLVDRSWCRPSSMAAKRSEYSHSSCNRNAPLPLLLSVGMGSPKACSSCIRASRVLWIACRKSGSIALMCSTRRVLRRRARLAMPHWLATSRYSGRLLKNTSSAFRASAMSFACTMSSWQRFTTPM